VHIFHQMHDCISREGFIEQYKGVPAMREYQDLATFHRSSPSIAPMHLIRNGSFPSVLK
jgi:hypothetical protein